MDRETRSGAEDQRQLAQRSLLTTYRRAIWGRFTQALQIYRLIEDGDRIAVCVSGGKDSMLLAMLFQELMLHGKRNFDAVFLALDPGYDPESRQALEANARLLGIELQVFPAEIFREVERQGGASPCYLCARMRRGYLYSRALALGCNKIALGHHMDDVIETTLLSILYGGQVQTMLPKLHSKNFPGMELIRPLYRVREADILRWQRHCGLDFLPCACRLSRERGPEGSKREAVKGLIRSLCREDSQVASSIFHSMENVHLGAVLGYQEKGVKHSFLDEYGPEQDGEEA